MTKESPMQFIVQPDNSYVAGYCYGCGTQCQNKCATQCASQCSSSH